MKIALLANSDWYLFGYRLALANELNNRDCNVTLVSPPGKYSEDILKAGFAWKPLRFSRTGINPITEILALRRFWVFYKAEEFDIVHHFTIKAVIYGSIIAKFVKIPFVINSITGLGSVFSSRSLVMKILSKFILLLYRYALTNTKVIFQNRKDMEYLLEKNIVSRRNVVLIRSSGVDIKKFVFKPEPGGMPTVLMASRLIKEKGVEEFVKSAKIINRHKKIANFILVGEPDLNSFSPIPRKNLIEWVNEEIIDWQGWKANMPKVLQAANIVCLPTYYGEGLPKILIEAAASGRAMVTTDVPGCLEIVHDGENGIVVESQNVGALVNAIEILLENPKLRKRMGNAGRILAEKEFSVHNVNLETLRIYPI